MMPQRTCAEDLPVSYPAGETESSPFLGLPAELRYAIYRHCHCLRSPNGKVEVVSNYLDGQPPTKMKFYTTRDLRLLEVNRQIQSEASGVFYAENIFTLNSYPRTQEYGQQRLYGIKYYHVNFSRVWKAHILSPRGFFPVSFDSCIQGAHRMRAFFRGIAEALAEGHCMKYLLVESYEFERAGFCRAGEAMACDLRDYLEPLEKVRGVQNCHIRAMKMSLWPYLRFLERGMMRSCRDLPLLDNGETDIVRKALACKQALNTVEIVSAFGDPDRLGKNKIFEIFNTKPLYRDVNFLDMFEEDSFNGS